MVYIVDTHALVWYLEESKNLGSEALSVLDDDQSKLVIPTIVLAEVKYLSSKQKTALSLPEVLSAIEQDERCVLFPLDSNVIDFLPTELDIHDAIICGTALVYQEVLKEEAKVITKDKDIVTAGIVETIW